MKICVPVSGPGDFFFGFSSEDVEGAFVRDGGHAPDGLRHRGAHRPRVAQRVVHLDRVDDGRLVLASDRHNRPGGTGETFELVGRGEGNQNVRSGLCAKRSELVAPICAMAVRAAPASPESIELGSDFGGICCTL